MSTTDRFGLQKLGAGEPFSTDNYKYSTADRDLIDELLGVGAETHHHTGAAASLPDATTNLVLAQSTSVSSSLLAGNTVYYKYTWVDAGDLQSSPSNAASIAVPSGLVSPNAPTLTPSLTGGTLVTGTYYYVLTSYVSGATPADTNESLGVNQASTSLSATATGKVTITMPSLPVGMTGFNIYRKKPGNATYYWLASQAGTAPFIDDGNPSETARVLPTAVGSARAINLTLPVLPAGVVRWRLYRSYNSTVWNDTYLTTGTGTTYQDVGGSVGSGTPPSVNQGVDSPSKINLTNAAEVQGAIPMGMAAYPIVWQYHFTGPVGNGTQPGATWFCDVPEATILDARVVIDHGSVANAGGLTVDILKAQSGATPTTATIYAQGATPTPRPTVAASGQVGTHKPPSVSSILSGDYLILKPLVSSTVGYTVIVRLAAMGFNATTSRVFGNQSDW